MWAPYKISEVSIFSNLHIYGEANYFLCCLTLDSCPIDFQKELSGECEITDSPLRVL